MGGNGARWERGGDGGPWEREKNGRKAEQGNWLECKLNEKICYLNKIKIKKNTCSFSEFIQLS